MRGTGNRERGTVGIPQPKAVREADALGSACAYPPSAASIAKQCHKRGARPPYQWDEGCEYWWDLSEVACFGRTIPCRGNMGMWQMPESLAAQVTAADALKLRETGNMLGVSLLDHLILESDSRFTIVNARKG